MTASDAVIGVTPSTMQPEEERPRDKALYCVGEGRQWKHSRKAVVAQQKGTGSTAERQCLSPVQIPATSTYLKDRKERQCLSHEGSGVHKAKAGSVSLRQSSAGRVGAAGR